MNSHIITFLNRYIGYENPQFAVMLSGKWGCGKTYFIKNWQKNLEDVKGNSLKPLYISLFGMHSIKEIRDALNRQLHPFLTSKSVKIFGKLANGLAKTVIKCDFSENAKPVEVSYELDLLSLFQTDNKDIKATGKIIIFDDLERCYIDKIEILGFINYFVEHCGCKVIVLCNEEKMTVQNHVKSITEEKESKHWKVQEIEETIPDSVYKEFKEKTIAFTFEVKPDIEGAIRYFISEIGSDPQNLITAMVPYIRQMLEQTNNNNMRIVRQCLFDFSSIVNEIPKDLYNKELYIPIMQKLLFDMIIFYLEAKANNPLFDDVDELRNYFLPGDKKESFSSLIKSYSNVPDSLNINILDYNSVEQINNFVRKGITPAPKLIEQISAEEKEKLPWEKLMQYWNLTNEEFRLNYALTSKKLKNRDIDNLDELMNIAFRLIIPEYHGICKTSKTFERDVLFCFQQTAKREIRSKNDLQNFRRILYSRLNYYSMEKEFPKWDDVISSMHAFLKELGGMFKSEMATLLENFTELDLNRLFELVDSIDPETGRTYTDCPMFHNANPEKVVKCIMRLTNQQRSLFRNILSRHYRDLDVSNYGSCKFYEGERENVTKIVALLKRKRLTGVDKYSVNSIVQKFEEFLNK